MNILISVQNLNMGGPSRFVLRLAKELGKENNIFIYDFYPYLNEINIDSAEYKNIHFLSVKNNWTDHINWKINSIIQKINGKSRYWEEVMKNHFDKCLLKYNIQIVLSTVKNIDYIVGPIARKRNIPFIVRLNSDYGINNNYSREDKSTQEIVNNLNGIIYTADFHFKNLKKRIKFSGDVKETKIMNGIESPSKNYHKPKKFPSSIEEDCIVFGMVARGIKEKGWEVTINAFQKLSEKYESEKLYLILVGGSDYVENIRLKNINKYIHFVGKTNDSMNWINQFDVCLLPTYFKNESTPNSLIEYLTCGKPVISTNYVEIPNMMEFDNKIAGRLINLKNGKPISNDLFLEMEYYLKNKTKIIDHGRLAKSASKKFNIKVCSQLYLDFFLKFN